jgi:hypothetical protein
MAWTQKAANTMKSLVLQQVATFTIACALLAPAACAEASDAKSFLDIKMMPNRDLQGEARGELRADAKELADLLNIKPLVSALRKSKEAGTDSTHLPRSLQQARMLCLWKILIASQEVRKVVAAINFNLSRSNATLDALSAKRDMTLDMLNTFNFMQGGILGTIKQAASFPGHTVSQAARQEIAMTSFGTGTALAAIGLFVPSLWSRKIEPPPNILVHVFDPNYRPADAERNYLWKFMNSPIPGSNLALTRRQILIKHWEDFEGLNSKDESRLKKLAASPSESEQLNESIRIISQRMDLLHDMKTHFEEFDTALYELHKAITFN